MFVVQLHITWDPHSQILGTWTFAQALRMSKHVVVPVARPAALCKLRMPIGWLGSSLARAEWPVAQPESHLTRGQGLIELKLHNTLGSDVAHLCKHKPNDLWTSENTT